MAAFSRVLVIFILGAGMKVRMIGQKLDVARLQIHVEIELGIARYLLIEIEALALLWRKIGHFSVARGRAEII